MIVVFVLLIAALGWLLLSGRDAAPEPTAHRALNPEINYSELEQAEREVQDASDEESVRDWGPGSGLPPQPPIVG